MKDKFKSDVMSEVSLMPWDVLPLKAKIMLAKRQRDDLLRGDISISNLALTLNEFIRVLESLEITDEAN